MKDKLLDGKSPGAQGTVSETGWSNSSVFLEYLDTHFLKYVQRPTENQSLILLFDGHKSHVTVPVILWAKQHNVVLFVLPAHTSHILQPLDVGCFGPLQRIYNSECHKFLRNSPASQITRFNVCALVCSAYSPALSVTNLRLAFKKTGIFPFNPAVIDDFQVAPSKAYIASTETREDIQSQLIQPEIFFQSAEKVISDKQTYSRKNTLTLLAKSHLEPVSLFQKLKIK